MVLEFVFTFYKVFYSKKLGVRIAMFSTRYLSHRRVTLLLQTTKKPFLTPCQWLQGTGHQRPQCKFLTLRSVISHLNKCHRKVDTRIENRRRSALYVQLNYD